MSDLTRTYSLPHGYSADFRWRDGHLEIEWSPAFPRIAKPRAWRRFLRAYQSVRRDFYQDIAAVLGINILIVDTDMKTIRDAEVITAPVRH